MSYHRPVQPTDAPRVDLVFSTGQLALALRGHPSVEMVSGERDGRGERIHVSLKVGAASPNLPAQLNGFEVTRGTSSSRCPVVRHSFAPDPRWGIGGLGSTLIVL